MRRVILSASRTTGVFRAFSTSSKSVLVYGGSGALGEAVVSRFVSAGWNTTSVDLSANVEASSSQVLNKDEDWKTQTLGLLASQQGQSFDAVINVAGGWGGDTAPDVALFDTFDFNVTLNLKTAVSACHVAANLLKPGGLVVLTGSAPVHAGGTGFMLSYGIAKAGLHHMVTSLATESGGMPNGSNVVCILPATIDTPGNRAGMPDADFDAWTRPEVISECLLRWSEGQTIDTADSEEEQWGLPPAITNGGFYKFHTAKIKGDDEQVADFVNDTLVSTRKL
jgi:dihydropteridine reductase